MLPSVLYQLNVCDCQVGEANIKWPSGAFSSLSSTCTNYHYSSLKSKSASDFSKIAIHWAYIYLTELSKKDFFFQSRLLLMMQCNISSSFPLLQYPPKHQHRYIHTHTHHHDHHHHGWSVSPSKLDTIHWQRSSLSSTNTPSPSFYPSILSFPILPLATLFLAPIRHFLSVNQSLGHLEATLFSLILTFSTCFFPSGPLHWW